MFLRFLFRFNNLRFLGIMKRFGMAVAALLMCATMSFAQKPSLSREPFVVSTEKLANYLQLTPSQLDEGPFGRSC